MPGGRRCRSPISCRAPAQRRARRRSRAFAWPSWRATRCRASTCWSTACRATPWARCSISGSGSRLPARRAQPARRRQRRSRGRMKIAVLGGGNGSLAAAGDFALAGHEVRLWRRDPGNGADTIFAETGTLPWLTRKHAPYEAAITIRAKRLPTGVFPLRREAYAIAMIGRAFPGAIEPCGDALSGALMNAGPIIHPPLIVMNAGPIEHFERWDIHKEGTQAAIRRVTDALDAERISVREALGYGAPHFPLAHHYATEGEIWMYGRGSHDRLTDSGDWRERLVLREHRYMREDLRLGLSFLVSVAELAGVATPLAKSFLAIGGAICGEDFMKNGRTLASLGLGG